MKIFFSFILSLMFISAISQRKDSLVANVSSFRLKKSFTVSSSQPDFLSVNPDSWNVNYNQKTEESYKFKLIVRSVFNHSSTIFDNTEIIFFDSSLFFAYHIDCMGKFCTAGSYKKDATLYSLTSNKVVFDTLKKKIDPYFSDFTFTDFKTRIFNQQKNQLLYLGSN